MVVEVAPEVAAAGDAADDTLLEVVEVAVVVVRVVVVHLIQAIWQRACQTQNVLHCYLRKRRRLEKLTGIRKGMTVSWMLMTMKKKDDNQITLGWEIKSDGATRRIGLSSQAHSCADYQSNERQSCSLQGRVRFQLRHLHLQKRCPHH